MYAQIYNRQTNNYSLITKPQHWISLLWSEASDGRGAGVEETFLALEEVLELWVISGLRRNSAKANARKEQSKAESIRVEHAPWHTLIGKLKICK